MKQGFRILNIGGIEIEKVCIQFMYKGVLVSASKILNGDVIGIVDDEIVFSEPTIELVIDKINSK